MNIEERIIEVFKNIFNLSSSENFEALTIKHLNNWDSINHLILVVSLEEEFLINFNENEIPNMHSFLTICDIIKSKVK